MYLKVIKKGDKTYYILVVISGDKKLEKFVTEKIYNALKDILKVY